MSRTLLVASAALFLTLPLSAQGGKVVTTDSAQEQGGAVQADTPEIQAAKQRNAKAAEAWQAMERELQSGFQGIANEAEQQKYIGEAVTKLKGFAEEWPKTESGLQALSLSAMFEIRALNRPEEGIKTLRSVYKQVKARPAALSQGSQFTLGRVGIDLADALQIGGHFDEAEQVLTEVAKLDGPAKERAEKMLAAIPMMKQTQVGKVLPTFTGLDLDGEELTPEQYRGKVVLVDFWATWCGPCVKEMPHVVEVYNKYKDTGFDVIGITLDREGAEDKIRKFTKENEMPWRQVYDGGGWGAAVAVKFSISSIPATFLLDRNGVIRAKDLRGDALEAMVAELMTEQL